MPTWANPAESVAGTSSQILSVTAGEDVSYAFTNATTVGGGIGAWSMLFDVAALPGATPDVSLTTSDGITISNPTSGSFAVAISSDITSNLAPGSYAWQIWRTGAGTNYPLAGGSLLVYGSVPPVT